MVRRPPLPILLLCSGAALAIALAIGATTFADAAKRVPKQPPIARVTNSWGEKIKTNRGSFCWRARGRGYCADTIDPMRRAPRLRIERRTSVVVHMRYPVEHVSASTRQGRRLRLKPIRGSERRFRLRYPPARQGRWMGVYIGALYDRGDALFAFKVSPKPIPGRSATGDRSE